MHAREKKEPQSKRWIVVAAVIVGAAVVLGGAGVIYLLGMPNKGSDGDRPSTTSSESRRSTSAPAADGCDVRGGDITDVPSDLQWQAANGVSWPVSPSLGPTSTNGEWPVCFSHSPVGAALAASTVLIGSLEHEQVDLVDFWVVDSAGKKASLDAASVGSSDAVAQSMKSKGMQLAGFRIEDYEEDRAVVLLVFSLPNSQTGYVGLQLTLVWVKGDWRLQVLDNGALTGQSVPVNAGQFTEWAPNG